MYQDYKAGPSGRPADSSAGIQTDQAAMLAARRDASALLDECDQMAGEMASASINRRNAKAKAAKAF